MTKAVIDTGKCAGHGQCAMMAPEVFDLDNDGYAQVLVDEVAPEMMRDAESAAQACPELAISLVD